MPSNNNANKKEETEGEEEVVVAVGGSISGKEHDGVVMPAAGLPPSQLPPERGRGEDDDDDTNIVKNNEMAVVAAMRVSSGMDGIPGAHPSTSSSGGDRARTSILSYALENDDEGGGEPIDANKNVVNETTRGGEQQKAVGNPAATEGRGGGVEPTVLRRTSGDTGRVVPPPPPGAFAHGGVQRLIVEDEEQPRNDHHLNQQQQGPNPIELIVQTSSTGGGTTSQDGGHANNNNNNLNEEGLVQANPVDDETNRRRPELPEAQELDPDVANQQRTTSQVRKEERKQLIHFLCLSCGLFILTVVIVAGVVVSRKDGGKNGTGAGVQQTTINDGSGGRPATDDAQNTPLPTTGAPSSSPTGVLDDLMLDLPPYTLESLKIFGTPQNLAWEWLRNHRNVSSLSLWKQKELFALATFFYSYEGPNWHGPVRERWMDDTKDICYWFSSGFGWFDDDYIYHPWDDQHQLPSCTDDGHFTRLWLGDLRLGGYSPSMPPELALLPNLTHIDLSNSGINNVTITELFPTNFFEEMTQLKQLILYVNGLSGTIPTEFGLMSNLLAMQFNVNALTGTLPSQIGMMRDLNNLGVWGNQLTGTLPTEIGLTANHEYLELGGGNSFTGTIPSEIGMIPMMLYMDFSSTPTLTGTFPQELSSMERLGYLDLTGCTGLSGMLPEEICYLADPNCTYTLWFGTVYPCYFGFNCTEHELLCGCDCPCSE